MLKAIRQVCHNLVLDEVKGAELYLSGKHSPSMFEALCSILSTEGRQGGKNVSGLGCNAIGNKPSMQKASGSVPSTESGKKVSHLCSRIITFILKMIKHYDIVGLASKYFKKKIKRRINDPREKFIAESR